MNDIIKDENTKKPKYMGLLLVIVLAIIVIGGYFLIKYSLVQTIGARGELESKEITLKNKESNLAALEKLVENYNKDRAKAEKIANTIPAEKDIPDILVQLEDIAKKSNMLFKSVKISESTEEQGVTEETNIEESIGEINISVQEETKNLKALSLDVEVQGSYDSLMSYLGKIESNIRIMDINSIKITSQVQAGTSGLQTNLSAGIFSYTINMKTYYISAD